MSELLTAYNALREAHGLPAVLGDPSPHETHRFISILYAAWKEREHWPELLAVERALRALAEASE